jgi:UMF1 family MFS transporter
VRPSPSRAGTLGALLNLGLGVALDRKQVGAWAMFDFANSSYSAVVTTAIFPVFYATYVVTGDGAVADGTGELWLSWADALAAFLVAVSVPLLGAIADRGGGRKKFMLFYTLLCVVGVATMTTLGPGMALWGLAVFVVAQVGFESAVVFYNAYLPDIAPPDRHGWVSGLGFGVGYLGSAVALVLAIPLANVGVEAVWLMVASVDIAGSGRRHSVEGRTTSRQRDRQRATSL